MLVDSAFLSRYDIIAEKHSNFLFTFPMLFSLGVPVSSYLSPQLIIAMIFLESLLKTFYYENLKIFDKSLYDNKSIEVSLSIGSKQFYSQI